mmetsp:Transcript_25060/g.67045  ORF Transcript_25060/g.67045 Transcript_25060/m.67045 type:complete len:180 (+) Transcript_25060:2-541(+)
MAQAALKRCPTHAIPQILIDHATPYIVTNQGRPMAIVTPALPFLAAAMGWRIPTIIVGVGAFLPRRGAFTAPEFTPWAAAAAPTTGDQLVAAASTPQPRSTPPENPMERELLEHQDNALIVDQDEAPEEPLAGGAPPWEVWPGLRLLAFGVVVEISRWAVSNERLSCGVSWPALIRFAM